jgi:hypothetical protein
MIIGIYYLVYMLLLVISVKQNVDLPSDTFMIILAILIAGEANYWKRGR